MRLLVKIGFVLKTLDVGKHIIQGLDDHARDPPGVVELTEQLQVFEVFRGFQLAPQPRAEASITGRQEVHVVANQPERALGHCTAHHIGSSLGMILGIHRLAHIVQQGRQQELLVVRPRSRARWKT